MPPVPTRPTKSRLTLPQVRILKALADRPEGTGLMRSSIAKIAGVSESMTGNLGPISNEKSVLDATTKRYGRTSLLALGYVTCEKLDIDGLTEYHYVITAAGIKELEWYLALNPCLPKKRDKELCINDRYSS